MVKLQNHQIVLIKDDKILHALDELYIVTNLNQRLLFSLSWYSSKPIK